MNLDELKKVKAAENLNIALLKKECGELSEMFGKENYDKFLKVQKKLREAEKRLDMFEFAINCFELKK